MASTSGQREITPLEELAALEDAQEKLDEGWACAQGDDLDTAIELLGEALSLRVDHFGDLAPECATAYYKYGCALFWKAQQESDFLGGPVSKIKEQQAEKADPSGKGKAVAEEEDEENEGGEGEDEVEEEESDMELAWKMLETARLIHEKQPGHTVEEADVITTLADISTEREDFETAVKDYGLALSILEELLQDDDRMLAEVCFKTCLAYQLWEQAAPAISYIDRAIATCERRLERLRGALQMEPAGKGKGKMGEEGVGEKETGKGGTGIEENAGKEPQRGAAEGGAVAEEGQKEGDGKGKVEEKGGAGKGPEGGAAEEGGDEEKARKEVGEIEALLVDLREKAEELREHAKHPNLAALQPNGPPPAGKAPVESSSFDAPQLTASASAPPITNLGVVGRGSARITPSPAPREATVVVPRKRTLEDMMGGGGDVSIGFGGGLAEAATVVGVVSTTAGVSGTRSAKAVAVVSKSVEVNGSGARGQANGQTPNGSVENNSETEKTEVAAGVKLNGASHESDPKKPKVEDLNAKPTPDVAAGN